MTTRSISSTVIGGAVLLLGIALAVIPPVAIRHALRNAAACEALDSNDQAVVPVYLSSLAETEMPGGIIIDDPLDERPILAEASDLRVQGLYKQAQRLAGRALAVAEQLHGAESTAVARVLNEIGILCKYTGRFEEGEQAYRRALMIVEKQPVPDQQILADLYHNLVGLAHARGRRVQAEAYARNSIEISRRLRHEHPEHRDGRSGACGDSRRTGQVR